MPGALAVLDLGGAVRMREYRTTAPPNATWPRCLPKSSGRWDCFLWSRFDITASASHVHLDGYVEVEAAYYGAPPGWIGRRVDVQWNDLLVRLLDPKTGQLVREHVRAAREAGVRRILGASRWRRSTARRSLRMPGRPRSTWACRPAAPASLPRTQARTATDAAPGRSPDSAAHPLSRSHRSHHT
jgi:hypothetical protein